MLRIDKQVQQLFKSRLLTNKQKKTVTDKIVANPKVAKKDRLPEPAQRQGAIAERMVADQAQAAPVNTEHDDDVLSHIKTIDGKKYYVQDDGTVKKNFAVELNGKFASLRSLAAEGTASCLRLSAQAR